MGQIVYRSNVVFLNGQTMPRWAEDRLRGYMDEAGVPSLQISSGYRSPEDQARIMSDNVRGTSMAKQRALYSSLGNQVLDAYPDQAAMVAVIRRIGPEHISRHMAEDAITFDIAPSSMPGGMNGTEAQALLSVLRAAPQNAKWRDDSEHIYEIGELYWPPKDPAIHVEFPNTSSGVSDDDSAGLGVGDVVVAGLILAVGYKVAQTVLRRR
jgi:hypothetical protein